MKRYGEIGLALLLDLIGSAGALLVALRTWQSITVRRAGLPSVTVDVSGRTIDSASLALGLVALAGIVAVLATKGLGRRIVGVVLALAGAGLVWRALASGGAVGTARARTLVADKRQSVSVDTVIPHVVVHSAWPLLSLVCGVVVLVSGVLIALRGHRWQAMSARYDAQPEKDADPTKVAASLWNALDRGEDPTDPATRS